MAAPPDRARARWSSSAAVYLARDRRRARAADRVARLRRRGDCAAGRRLRRLRRGALPGDLVRAVAHQRKRSYAQARTIEALIERARTASSRSRSTRGAVAGAALRAPARDQAGSGRGRAAADRHASTASSSSRSCRRSSGGVTATSSSTRSAGRQSGALVCGFHAPSGGARRWRSRTACSAPSAQPGAETASGWAREQFSSRGSWPLARAAPRVRPIARARAQRASRVPCRMVGLPAQPRGARGPPHGHCWCGW